MHTYTNMKNVHLEAGGVYFETLVLWSEKNNGKIYISLEGCFKKMKQTMKEWMQWINSQRLAEKHSSRD